MVPRHTQPVCAATRCVDNDVIRNALHTSDRSPAPTPSYVYAREPSTVGQNTGRPPDLWEHDPLRGSFFAGWEASTFCAIYGSNAVGRFPGFLGRMCSVQVLHNKLSQNNGRGETAVDYLKTAAHRRS